MREIYVKEHPNESGFQPRLGETTFDLGDLYSKMADDQQTSAKNQTRFWQEATLWYQRSLEIWQKLSTEGTLPGYQATKPDETLKAIAKCDDALAKFQR